MSLAESNRRSRRLFLLVFLDAVIVSFLTWSMVAGRVPVITTAVISYSVLFAVNFLIIWKIFRRPIRPTGKGGSISYLGWLGVAAFTINSVVWIISCAEKPDARAVFGAAVAVILAAYAWYLVYRVGQVPDTHIELHSPQSSVSPDKTDR
jgi:hypothetical protein